jgi:hypothetical protein
MKKKRFVDPEKKVGRKRNSLYEQGDLLKRMIYKVCSIKFRSKDSIDKILCLLRNLMEQTVMTS